MGDRGRVVSMRDAAIYVRGDTNTRVSGIPLRHYHPPRPNARLFGILVVDWPSLNLQLLARRFERKVTQPCMPESPSSHQRASVPTSVLPTVRPALCLSNLARSDSKYGTIRIVDRSFPR